ncbi:MAG TPA: LpxD N-terminal domain-containing protein, partial [Candidatus Dormibacteraeota bacterium]|nr:LpxD N-terminal domain-containing protein [Candidatus Dormibacteraeota bacterium]
MTRTAKEIAEHIGAQIEGDESLKLISVAAPERAGAYDLIYLDSAKHADRVAASAAHCVVAPREVGLPGKTVLRAANARLAFAQAAAFLIERPSIARGIHPTAVIGSLAKVSPTASIGPYAVIGEDSTIGAGTQIGAHAVVGAACWIGENCR